MAAARESLDEARPVAARQSGMWQPELKYLDAMIEGLDPMRRSNRQGVKVDRGEDLRLCTGGAILVDTEQRIP